MSLLPLPLAFRTASWDSPRNCKREGANMAHIIDARVEMNDHRKQWCGCWEWVDEDVIDDDDLVDDIKALRA